MKFSSISDVHIKAPKDEQYELLLNFLRSTQVKESDHVFLLGDIFDLLIGDHSEYLKDYKELFDEIDDLIKNGAVVHYFEGNHDFHLTNLFKKFAENYNHKFQHDICVHKEHFILTLEDSKKVFLSHGDDIELYNPSYQVYKKIVNNPFMYFVANYLMPYSLLNYIGMRMSKASRKRNSVKYDWNARMTKVKGVFRESAKVAQEKYKVDDIVVGHSHVQDNFSEDGLRYLNNGYAPIIKQFIHFDGNEYQFISLA